MHMALAVHASERHAERISDFDISEVGNRERQTSWTK